MAHNAYWKGHIRLSLVTFPIRLHAAITRAETLSLHKYDKDSGDRIHYQNVDSEGDEVPDEDIIKGYEYEKGSFVPIDDEDLEKLKLESKHTLDLVQFVKTDEIDPIYFEKSYYAVPDGEIANEAYATVRNALQASGKSAIGQIVLNRKERLVCLRPCSKGLIVDTLRYNYEVRKAEEYFDEIPDKIKVSDEQVELAEELIDKKTKAFDPKAFKDHYQEGLKEIIEGKLEGKDIVISEEKESEKKVVDIVEALKKSLESADKNVSKKSKRKKSKSKKTKGKAA